MRTRLGRLVRVGRAYASNGGCATASASLNSHCGCASKGLAVAYCVFWAPRWRLPAVGGSIRHNGSWRPPPSPPSPGSASMMSSSAYAMRQRRQLLQSSAAGGTGWHDEPGSYELRLRQWSGLYVLVHGSIQRWQHARRYGQQRYAATLAVAVAMRSVRRPADGCSCTQGIGSARVVPATG